MLSTVLILPADQVATGNAVAEAMGWGPNNYSVPLFTVDEITHYGLHAWTSDEFYQMIETRSYPSELASVDITEDMFNTLMDALIYSFRTEHINHFRDICDENNLIINNSNEI